MSNAAQRLGPPSGAGWTCKQCGTRNRIDATSCIKCSAQQKQADNTIDLRNGQRAWEGEHRVVLVSRDLPMNAELLIDGKGIHNAKRIEIDLDCDKPTAYVKITHLDVSCEDELQQRKQYVEMLTANLLNITLEEARVVDVILNKARQEALSNSMAVQLFAITESDEQADAQTTQVLGTVLRDAARYRALRLNTEQPQFFRFDLDRDLSPALLDHLADEMRQRQADARRAEQQQAQS